MVDLLLADGGPAELKSPEKGSLDHFVSLTSDEALSSGENENYGVLACDKGGSDSDSDNATERYRLVVSTEPTRTKNAVRKQNSGPSSFRGPKPSSGDHVDVSLDSVSHVMKEQQAEKIICSPREYQIELFERAKEKNTIIVLDTGSGKTLIAALLLRHTLDLELERRANKKVSKVAFFLVETVALCFQQYNVLRSNLEYPVAKFHGDTAGSLRTKEEWDSQVQDNMAIVCTAQVLLDLLNSGFLNMSQINLLIFDEAHHTKKSHPYARIVREHYLRMEHDRPRILGMTASPVDAQTIDLKAAAMELEHILCSEIATVSDETLARSMARRQQTEQIVYFDRPLKAEHARTELWNSIFPILEGLRSFRVHLEASEDVAVTLGAWCADRYWEILLTQNEIQKQIAKSHSDNQGQQTVQQQVSPDYAIDMMQRAYQSISTRMPLATKNDFSPKVNALRQILGDAFCGQTTRRCIVFVQRRYNALILAECFQKSVICIDQVRAGFVVGSQTAASSFINMSLRDQVMTLQRFRNGEINCLFATQVAEEGIDIPDCDLIVRFDLCDSAIQYIQSKGRARQIKSTFISMLEENNLRQLRQLKRASRDAFALRRFCSALPSDRKIEDVNQIASALEQEIMAEKVFEIPTTGARLTLASSQEVLARFVSSLSSSTDSYLRPDYVVCQTPCGGKFVASIVFPEACPVKCIHGFPQRSKLLARSSAAFEACIELLKRKYINGHLQSTLKKRLPAMRNARLAISSNKRAEYPMRTKPELWAQEQSKPLTELYANAIEPDVSNLSGPSMQPLIILTRTPLPHIEPTTLYMDDTRRMIMKFLPVNYPIQITPERMRALASFTLTVFEDVFSKRFEVDDSHLPYYVAPAAVPESKLENTPMSIDWPILDKIERNSKDRSAEDLSGSIISSGEAFVFDPKDGSRKYLLNRAVKDLKPYDPVPDGVPMPKNNAYRKVEHNIAEYSNSLYLKSRKLAKWNPDQPVFEAELLSLRRNFFDVPDDREDKWRSRTCYIILEPLVISQLPADVVRMALFMPSLLYRIESVLIVMDACKILNLDLHPTLALEAFTKDSSIIEQKFQTQPSRHRYINDDYERLEFLGDSFLKMATTISLFTITPDNDEFGYHVERMLMVCNQNLFNHAVDRKLAEYIRSKTFDRRTWYPDLPLKSGKYIKIEDKHSLADKSVADVCEAVIGAAYMTEFPQSMDMAVKAVTKMVRSKNHKMKNFKDYYEAHTIHPWHTAPTTAAQRYAAGVVEKVTGYQFNSPTLLRSAFKHPSYHYETNIPNYQRLEFLGDALLDFAVVDYLFRNFPEADPRWMTEHKMMMVSNQFFACLCVELGLHKHLVTTSAPISGAVANFVTELEEAKRASQSEDGTSPQANFWTKVSNPPKALSDVVESVVGAMFEDSQYDYAVVRSFFADFILPYFKDMAIYRSYSPARRGS